MNIWRLEEHDRIKNISWLLSDPAEMDVYFTTDGKEPDPFNRRSGGGTLVTHRYKGPFTLRPGRRSVRAVAVTK